MQKKIRWEIRPEAWILGAALIFLLPLGWSAAALTAAAFHELCHALAVWGVGGNITAIRVGFGGVEMETSPMDRTQAIACSLAGPAGELLLVCLCHVFPRLAVCALLQAAFNLLPILPLDGGRALRNGLGILLPEKIAEKVFRVVQGGTMGALAVLAVLGALRLQLRLLPFVLVVPLLREKVLAKKHRGGYNSPTIEMR